jgi:uncharacterized membrane protein YesL
MFKGFFNRMYNGNPNRPDIDPDDMPKNKFELFFTTLGIRIGDLIKLNLLFVVFLLPFILWTALSFLALNAGFEDLKISVLDAANSEKVNQFLLGQLQMYLYGLIIVLPLAGPPLAGLTYVTRNYARDEHAWLWSDFKEQMKKNWKQSVVVMLILAFVLILVFFTLQVYAIAQQSSSWMWVMQLLFIIFIGLFILSYMYVFPMLVTYKLKIGQILRNSLMLALGRLPFTVLFGFMAVFPFVLAALILVMNFSIINYVFLGLVIYFLLLGFALTAFIVNSYTNATFEKLLRSDDEQPPPDAGDDDKTVKP